MEHYDSNKTFNSTKRPSTAGNRSYTGQKNRQKAITSDNIPVKK